jgi:hypothetical protein
MYFLHIRTISIAENMSDCLHRRQSFSVTINAIPNPYLGFS